MTAPLAAPQITPGVWDTAALLAWLHALDVDQSGAIKLVPGVIGQAIPKMPDRICVVTDTSGGPLEAEGLIDTPSFQVRFRGPQADPFGAQRDALRADRLILFPTVDRVAGVRVLSVDRSGGRPTALLPDPSPGLRSEYVCTYRVRVATLEQT